MTTAMFDAAVVGGGPAGCSAAITLAQRGARVVMFEAKTYPHHKVCGEFLSPECAQLLDQLSFTPTFRALNPVPIETAHITTPSGATWETRLPGTAWGLSRHKLDAALAEHARALGVDVREGATVTRIEGSIQTGFDLGARAADPIRARTVIAAYGKRGSLDRLLQRRFLIRQQPFMALKAYFRGIRLPERIELHTFPGGYCGMSEIEDSSINVCLLAHETVFHNAPPNGQASIDAFMRWMQSQNPHLRRRLSSVEPASDHWLSIAQIPFVEKEPVVDDVLMAGDAAGLIVPLAGDGIAMALHGGRLAATQIANYLAGESTAEEIRQRYRNAWQREFTARLRLGRALQAIMLRPQLLAPGLRLLTAFPRLGDYLVAHTRDSRIQGIIS